MDSFDALHPALQHHIVNTLGWRELRRFQNEAIPLVLGGKHVLILAPTAGGKTEAALFPVLSRVLTESWQPLSVLYLCPLKALLNNLDTRLRRYCEMVGRRSGLWHGDVSASLRKATLADPPDCLLTTPESLEVMLVSSTVDEQRLFAGLRSVIVDEIHAFAGDDRGWHVLALLARIQRLAGRELQRVGLSATVGNPDELLDWLAGTCDGSRETLLPQPTDELHNPAVQLDFVGSLENAALVISRLHRGEKRLVFVDSRARAEQLGAELRRLEVPAFVTHSSLGKEQRHEAEGAFASHSDAVIVATSVLELGIDIGNLDRVIQVDSPGRVSSLLQRMGRTGRRAGASRNCLFLATHDDALLQAAGLVELWASGFVEPVDPPPEPYHIFAQQLMALALQEGGLGRDDWQKWIGTVPPFHAMGGGAAEVVIDWMLEQKILWADHGILWLGPEGERTFGRKHFLELFSVFSTPPLFRVLHGRAELGWVHESTFFQKTDRSRVLLLGGRSWQVNHIDWQRRQAYVEATEERGRSRWTGESRPLGFRHCQAIREVLASPGHSALWSDRATKRLGDVRERYSWLQGRGTVIVFGRNGETTWWTFAGSRANATLADALGVELGFSLDSDGMVVGPWSGASLPQVESAVQATRNRSPRDLWPAIDGAAVAGLKFSACLPPELGLSLLRTRMRDLEATKWVLDSDLRVTTDAC